MNDVYNAPEFVRETVQQKTRRLRRTIAESLAGRVPHWSQSDCDYRAAYIAAEHGETDFYTFTLRYLRGGPYPLMVWTFDERTGDTFFPVTITVDADCREDIRSRAASALIENGNIQPDDAAYVQVITYRPQC